MSSDSLNLIRDALDNFTGQMKISLKDNLFFGNQALRLSPRYPPTT